MSVATQRCPRRSVPAWLPRARHGMRPQLKPPRRDLVKVAEARGVEVLDGRTASTGLREFYDHQPG
jgi:hypothetical protein